MTNQPYDDETNDDLPEVPDPQENVAGLRRAANKAKSLEAQLSAARRELAFAKSGIDLSDARMGYFVKGYEGDLEPDAIKKAATEAGFIAPPAPSTEQVQAQEAQARMAAVVGGAAVPGAIGYEAQMDQAFAAGGQDGLLTYLANNGFSISSDQ